MQKEHPAKTGAAASASWQNFQASRLWLVSGGSVHGQASDRLLSGFRISRLAATTQNIASSAGLHRQNAANETGHSAHRRAKPAQRRRVKFRRLATANCAPATSSRQPHFGFAFRHCEKNRLYAQNRRRHRGADRSGAGVVASTRNRPNCGRYRRRRHQSRRALRCWAGGARRWLGSISPNISNNLGLASVGAWHWHHSAAA